MFDTVAKARQVFEERFAPEQVDLLVDALVPTLVFKPKASSDLRIGETRIGGEPDLSPDHEWPVRPIPKDPNEIAGRGGPGAAEEIRQHLERGLPYIFMAQIDLSEATSLGPIAAALPDTGRLLFFYDAMAGPFDPGTESARVIWDDCPQEHLARREMPAALKEAGEDYWTAFRTALEAMLAEHGLDVTEEEFKETPYGGPAKPIEIVETLRPPDCAMLEFASAELGALYRSAYGNSADPDSKLFAERYDDLFEVLFSPDYVYRGHQLLGLPVPVQHDPRFEAVNVMEESELPYFESSAKAVNWQLLLQVDMFDFCGSDGTVYFLVRNDDLENRNFENVVAVYQQT